MICRVYIIGDHSTETDERPICSQTDPVRNYKLLINTENINRSNLEVKSSCGSAGNNNQTPNQTPNHTPKLIKHKIAGKTYTGTILFHVEVISKRRVKLKSICEYLHEKLKHFKIN